MLTPQQLQEAADAKDAPKRKELEAFIDKQLEDNFTHIDGKIIIDRPAGFTQRVVNTILGFYAQWWNVAEDSDDRGGSYFTFKCKPPAAEAPAAKIQIGFPPGTRFD